MFRSIGSDDLQAGRPRLVPQPRRHAGAEGRAKMRKLQLTIASIGFTGIVAGAIVCLFSPKYGTAIMVLGFAFFALIGIGLFTLIDLWKESK